MSQNRRAYKDRLSAEQDYEVNLKAELEIMALDEKMDLLREAMGRAYFDSTGTTKAPKSINRRAKEE